MKIPKEKKEIIESLGDGVTLNPCFCTNKSQLSHKDSCLRYFGLRKKSIIYNNTENDIYIVISPFIECKINTLNCTKYFSITCLTKNNYTQEFFHLKAGHYKKFTVPTYSFGVTVAVKYNTVEKQSIKSYVDKSKDNKPFYQPLLNLFNGPDRKDVLYKSVNKQKIEWKLYCKNKTYHCGNDIFLNGENFKVLHDLETVDFNNIGKISKNSAN